jgi:AAA ATPase domain
VGGLFGREAECGRLQEVLERARQGLSGVLVLRGEPGTGKTALLDYVQAAAGGFDVVRFDGVETEAELGFAALHQILRPYLDRLDALPGPQRDALGLVFGLREHTSPPDRFLVGLASLALLTGGPGRPLLCVVDDAHCLDQESADVLTFIGRRLYADSVAMVFALRESSARRDLLTGLPDLRVTGLPAAAAEQLLASAAGRPADAAVSARLIAETGGNPLALVEVAQELTPAQLAGDAPLPEPVPLGHALGCQKTTS